MAKTFSTESIVEMPADCLLALMTDPAEVHGHSLAMGALRAEVSVPRQTAEEIAFAVCREEPSWHGGDTKKATFLQQWHLPSRTCSWTRQDHDRPELISVNGTIRITPVDQESCRLSEQGFIEVRIPFFGSRIEKIIAKDLTARQDRIRLSWESRNPAVTGAFVP